jgi:hypothetical protein
MNNGLTVTCISANKKGKTLASFNKFGDRYWDDCIGNKSKPGYYIAFYYQKKEVYIHQIEKILSPAERPADMDWESNKNILCFGKRLITIPWEEWKTGIGKGAPYTFGNYRITQTTTIAGFDCSSFIIPNEKQKRIDQINAQISQNESVIKVKYQRIRKLTMENEKLMDEKNNLSP